MPLGLIRKAIGLGEGGVLREAFQALLGHLSQLTTNASASCQRASFTIAFVALSAKMAKADGCVAPIEAETFHRMYEVAADEVVNVRRVFDLAARDSVGFETYARQIAKALRKEPQLLRDVFDALFCIAAADGIIHPGEDRFLRTVAAIFKIDADELAIIRSAFVHDGAIAMGNANPYGILGVSPTISVVALKARHRVLVREHHPDALIARGIPIAFHTASANKLAVFNAAYDAILKQRSLRSIIEPETVPR